MSFKESMFSGWLVWIATVAACGLAPSRALAQALPPPTPAASTAPRENGLDQVIDNQTYTYVEQMPKLPGGGGMQAIIEAIQSQIHYPPAALRQRIQGRVLVGFVIGKNGAVRDSKILRSVGGGCDEVVLNAVRRLPRFVPGRQQGKPVSVSFTVPVSFRLPTFPMPAPDTVNQVYFLVDQMPQLPGGGGNPAIFRAIQRAVVMPAEIAHDTLPRKVFVGFIVGASGVVRDVKIVRKLNPACDAAAMAAVRKLPRFIGGKLNGMPVSVGFTVPVLFGRLPKE